MMLSPHGQRDSESEPIEDSLQERLKNWTYLATDFIPYRPLGIGLGEISGSVALQSDVEAAADRQLFHLDQRHMWLPHRAALHLDSAARDADELAFLLMRAEAGSPEARMSA